VIVVELGGPAVEDEQESVQRVFVALSLYHLLNRFQLFLQRVPSWVAYFLDLVLVKEPYAHDALFEALAALLVGSHAY